MTSSVAGTSNKAKNQGRKSTHTSRTPSSRRTWTPEEELSLVAGLKELCANGWRGDNGTFRHGYLVELERYMTAHHPNYGLRAVPNVDSKIRAWKKSYAVISLLKSRSGLGFQYSDGTILVDDPKAWDDLIKIDSNAKSMNSKKWPLFADWEEIFGKDRATGEFAEGPENAVEEMEIAEAQGVSNNMSLGFPSILLDGDDDPATGEDHAAQREPNVSPGASQSPFDSPEPTEPTGATQGSFSEASQNARTQQANKQGNNSKASSSRGNEKDRRKKRKITSEDENETDLKGFVEAMKRFDENHDNRMGALIGKLGERDFSDVRGKIISILESPSYELYNANQRFKAGMYFAEDVKRMEYFLSMGELDRQAMVRDLINDNF